VRSSALVYEAVGTLIVRLPAGPIVEDDGIPVRTPSECFIAFEQHPLFVSALRTNWVDVSRRRDADVVRNWFGNFVNYDDMEAGASVHTISPKEWLSEPALGRSFYGLVRYYDCATPSDFLKGDRLVEKDDFARKQNLGYYLSFPVGRIREVRGQIIAEICRSKLSLDQKADCLFKLLK
jgi:hypothetical protein